MPGQLACGFELGRHLGETKADRLVFDDDLTEGLSFACVGKCGLEGRARDADCLGRDADAATFQIGERDAVAVTGLAEHMGVAQFQIFQRHFGSVAVAMTEFVFESCNAIAASRGRREKGRDAAFAGLGLGAGDDHRELRALAGGDEMLGAVQDPAFALSSGARADGGGVGAGVALGQQKAAAQFAARQGGEKSCLLIGAAVIAQRGAHR